jgi:hypothetical protein
MSYQIFTRNWWREARPEDGNWPNNLVPDGTTRRNIARVDTEEEAQEYCREYNNNHSPGRLSRKAEYTII